MIVKSHFAIKYLIEILMFLQCNANITVEGGVCVNVGAICCVCRSRASVR